MPKSLKEQYIKILQRYGSSWVDQKIELEVYSDELFDSLAKSNIPLNELKGTYKSQPQTVLLWDTDFILSPIHLDHNIELPIIELFFDNNNFVLFTTHNIYNCRKTVMVKYSYQDIKSIDENSIHQSFYGNGKDTLFNDIIFIDKQGEKIMIIMYKYISMGLILVFLKTAFGIK